MKEAQFGPGFLAGSRSLAELASLQVAAVAVAVGGAITTPETIMVGTAIAMAMAMATAMATAMVAIRRQQPLTCQTCPLLPA